MAMKARLTIRVELLALVLSIILPITILFVLIKSDEMAGDISAASMSVYNIAEVASASTERFVADIQSFMSVAAADVADHPLSATPCSAFLPPNPIKLPPGFANILVVDPYGRLVCSAVQVLDEPGITFTDRLWFQGVMRTDQFIIGDPLISRTTGKWVIPFVYPLHNAQGTLVGALVMSLDLAHYHFMLDSVTLPPNSVLTIVNRSGTVVMRTPDPEDLLGKDTRGSEVVNTVLAQPNGFVEAAGIDGINRVFGFTTMPDMGWHVYVGIPADAVLAPVRATLLRYSLIQFAVILMALLFAVFLSQRISKPISVVASAARAVKEGRLQTRAPVGGPQEIAEVAAEFNAMLDVRHEVERALSDSEARLRLILSQLPVMLWTTDTQLHFTSSSGKGFEAIHVAPGGLVGQSLVHVFGEEHTIAVDLVIQSHRRALDGLASVYLFEWENRIYESHVEPLCNAEGLIFGCVGIGLDITERKHAEEALQRSERYFRALIENSAERVLVFNAEGIILYTSPHTHGFLDYFNEEIVGTNRFTRIHPDDVEEEKKIWNTFITEPEAIVTNQYRVRRKDSSWAWIERTLHNLLDDPDIRAVVGNYRDVTERIVAEEALRQREELFRALIENSLEGITLLNANANVIYRSPGAERIAAYSVEDAQIHTALNFVHPDDRPRMDRLWETLIQEPGKVVQQEFRFKHRDSTSHWYEIIFHNLLDNPSVHAIVTNYRDITDRKQQEEAVRNYMRRLEGIHEIDADILSARSLSEITSAVLQRITTYIAVEAVYILLFDLEKRVARVYASAPDASGEFVLGTPVRFDSMGDVNGLLDQLQNGQMVVSGDFFGIKPQSAALQQWLSERHRTNLGAPIRSHNQLIGVLSLSREAPEAYSPGEVDLIREVTDSLAIAITQQNLFDEISAGRDRLRFLSQQLVDTQEATSRRLAHDLHDQVGTNLTALGINLNVMRNQLPLQSSRKLKARLSDSLKLLDETVDRIRDVMTDLRPAVLDDYGLDAALRWYAGQYSKRTEIEVNVQSKELLPRPAAEIETALFRILQEALTNVAKHAQAGHVNVTLDNFDGQIRLTISDDGIGFDSAEHNAWAHRHGMGLIGMAERAESIGGQLVINAKPGKGTQIVIDVGTQHQSSA